MVVSQHKHNGVQCFRDDSKSQEPRPTPVKEGEFHRDDDLEQEETSFLVPAEERL